MQKNSPPGIQKLKPFCDSSERMVVASRKAIVSKWKAQRRERVPKTYPAETDEVIRIISARKATRYEEESYFKKIRK